MNITNIKRISSCLWELPKHVFYNMKAPARIYASKKLIQNMDNKVLEQLFNIASLPGIINHAYCMPDGHSGYGFPIGGVAAMDLDKGVISPGGIGFDINCGMRLVSTNLTYDEVKPHIKELMDHLFISISSGINGRGNIKLSQTNFEAILKNGAKWLVQNGYGWNKDLEATEDNGCISGADISKISQKAINRGYKQLGTLGSGNHYLEIQFVREADVFNKQIANRLGLNKPNQVVIMFHCGSRAFGHQVATDYIKYFLKIMRSRYNLNPIDRELACVPFLSEDGQNYFSAMKCAANMAYANRQVILHKIRTVFTKVFGKSPQGLGLYQIYDVCHNMAKIEKHKVDGELKEILVHRKGATRALGPNAVQIPKKYIDIGQPVIVGGSMETGSYLLVGADGGTETFYSASHGSGRKMSRSEAKKCFDGKSLADNMDKQGIYVKTKSIKTLAEEAGGAYKDINEIVNVLTANNLCKPVARFRPIGNMKG